MIKLQSTKPTALLLFNTSASNIKIFFFFSSRRRHTRWTGDWSSDVCSSDLHLAQDAGPVELERLVGLRNAVHVVPELHHHPVVLHGRPHQLRLGERDAPALLNVDVLFVLRGGDRKSVV